MADQKGVTTDSKGQVFASGNGEGTSKADYDTMNWKQIRAVVTGNAAVGKNDRGKQEVVERAASVSSPESLWEAARDLRFVQEVVTLVGNIITDQVNDLTSDLSGQEPAWKGPAADAFRAMMKPFVESFHRVAEQIAGGPTGAFSAPTQLYNAGEYLNWARRTIWQIDQHYASEIRRIGKAYNESYATGDGEDSWYKIEYQMPNGNTWVNWNKQVVEMMNNDMRRVLKTLAGHYEQVQYKLEPQPVRAPNRPLDLPKPQNPKPDDLKRDAPDLPKIDDIEIKIPDFTPPPLPDFDPPGNVDLDVPELSNVDLDGPDQLNPSPDGSNPPPLDLSGVDLPDPNLGGPIPSGLDLGGPTSSGLDLGGPDLSNPDLDELRPQGSGLDLDGPQGFGDLPGLDTPGSGDLLPPGNQTNIPLPQFTPFPGGGGVPQPTPFRPGGQQGGGSLDVPPPSGVGDLTPPGLETPAPGTVQPPNWATDGPQGLGSSQDDRGLGGMPPMMPPGSSPNSGAPDRSDASGLIGGDVEPWKGADLSGLDDPQGSADLPPQTPENWAAPAGNGLTGSGGMPPMMPPMMPPGSSPNSGAPDRSDASGLIGGDAEPWRGADLPDVGDPLVAVEVPKVAPEDWAVPEDQQQVLQGGAPPVMPPVVPPSSSPNSGAPDRSDASGLIGEDRKPWEGDDLPGTGLPENPALARSASPEEWAAPEAPAVVPPAVVAPAVVAPVLPPAAPQAGAVPPTSSGRTGPE
ncbi:WXG100 family type VII secretion target, partial [Saccharothrix sp. Mg75]|uniref:WXG100 family type VII secretion target n=1 Tax=Saccharothrix sp. Mg75 TaxID=3445357 RepID=UPI003EEA3B11